MKKRNLSTLFVKIKSDLYRYTKTTNILLLFKMFFFSKGFRFIFYYRIGNKLCSKKILLYAYNIFFSLLSDKYTINIPLKTKIGYGLYIGHAFSIAISKKAIIGNNVNISQNVTIGKKQTGDFKGVPVIGNNVYIGPNATVIGKIKIGNNVVIGANSVVSKSIPDNAVVAGVPAKIISYKGTEGIVNNKWMI